MVFVGEWNARTKDPALHLNGICAMDLWMNPGLFNVMIDTFILLRVWNEKCRICICYFSSEVNRKPRPRRKLSFHKGLVPT